jgi:hypothetical protein
MGAEFSATLWQPATRVERLCATLTGKRICEKTARPADTPKPDF